MNYSPLRVLCASAVNSSRTAGYDARMERINISSGRLWESIVGYSRAVRKGPFICVTGTLGCDESGEIIAPGDAYAQTVAALQTIVGALEKAGATAADVVRTRMFVIDIDKWQDIGRAHAEFFGEVRPATTMVEVSRLITPEALVEIEADAIVGE